MDEYDELKGRIAKMLFLMADAVANLPANAPDNPPLPAANPMLAAMWRQAQRQQGA